MTDKEESRLDVEIEDETHERLREYPKDTGKTQSEIVDHAINNEITRCEVKNILKQSCEEGKLPADSKLCRHLEKGGEHHHLSY
ncbi:MAG: RepB family protein [Candidatus Nitrosopolaris sp.]